MSASAEILSEWLRKIACSNSQERFKLLEAASEILRLTDELQECQAQRRAAFRRIEELDRELDAMRAQIGQCEPSQAASDAYDRIDHFLRQKLDDHDYTQYSFDLDLVWGASIAPQQKPHTA